MKNGLDQKLFVLEEALDEAIAAFDDYNQFIEDPVEDAVDDVFTTLENASECDLPLGYGRD